MPVAFDEAKARMTDALAKRPSDKDEWGKLIRAAEDILRTAGVRQ